MKDLHRAFAAIPCVFGLTAGATAQGDLSISMALEDTSASSGGNVSLDYTVWNTSSEEVETTVAFYLSADATFDAGDTFLESEGISIDENESESDSEQVGLPSVANGSYYVLAYVDPNNTVAETDEGNNVAADALLVGTLPNASTAQRDPCNGAVLVGALSAWASAPELGDDFVVEIDDPADLEGFASGTPTFWLIATRPLPVHPCGVVVDGFGPGGSDGEVLIDLSVPPAVVPPIPLFGWNAPGDGALHEILVPNDVQLAGAVLYTQALFVAGDGRVVVTNALDATIGV